ncbi:mitochondrial ribosomal protein subunit L20-domain-containing protein [Zopfochytrium polystomum]|nr:mitochondrial ribosomal protein subunit L20-domain-containing protein [Zopfochytrium polystomum]
MSCAFLLRSLHTRTINTPSPARSFYTHRIEKPANQLRLDDGSILTLRKAPSPLAKNIVAGADADATASAVLDALTSSNQSSKHTAANAPIVLPPRLRRAYPQRSILTEAQIHECRQLRESDPDTWTVSQLAKRYNTFPGFILSIAPCPAERKAFLREQREREFERLPISKKVTAIDRMRRKMLW